VRPGPPSASAARQLILDGKDPIDVKWAAVETERLTKLKTLTFEQVEAERQIPVVFLQASECAVAGQAHEAVPPEANAGYLVQPDEGRHRHPITLHNLSPAATPNQKMAAEVHIAPLRLRSLSAANFASLSTTRCVRVAALPIATA